MKVNLIKIGSLFSFGTLMLYIFLILINPAKPDINSQKNQYGDELLWNSEVVFKKIKAFRDNGQLQKAFLLVDQYYIHKYPTTDKSVISKLETLYLELAELSGHNKQLELSKATNRKLKEKELKELKEPTLLSEVYNDKPKMNLFSDYYEEVESKLFETINNPLSLDMIKCSEAKFSVPNQGWITDCEFRMTNEYGALMRFFGTFKIARGKAETVK